MRLFVALLLPAECRSAVADYCRAIAPAFVHARPSWVSEENLHFTLHFFGEVDPVLVPKLAGHLEACRQLAPPLDLRTGGLSFLPSARVPRILHMNAAIEPSPRLLSLVDELRAIAADLGAETDSRPWKAHLTLARLKENRVPQLSELPPPPRISTQLRSFALIASTLERSGARYSIVGEFPLG